MRKMLAKTYDPQGIEDRIYKNWEDKKSSPRRISRDSSIWDTPWTIRCRIS